MHDADGTGLAEQIAVGGASDRVIAVAGIPEPVGAASELAIADVGPVRNTLLQLVGQLAGIAFTAGLTLYLVRALGPRGYGVYTLAVSIGALLLFPAGLGLPFAVARFLADHIGSLDQLRAIFRMGLGAQIVFATVVALALFAAADPVANAYGVAGLAWPLRWVALSIIGQALFGFLNSTAAAVRRASIGLRMMVLESATETGLAIALVVGGAGVAGATLGKLAGYTVAAAAGIFLTLGLLGGRRGGRQPSRVGMGTLMRYAGAMLIVDVAWSAIAQIDILLIGAILGSVAVGSFGAVSRLLPVLTTLGLAASAGVAPRLSLRTGQPDVHSFEQALRYLTIFQGITIAPMLVWSKPIVDLLLGSQYGSSAAILRALTFYSFFGASAPLITLTITYLGEARRRVPAMLITLVFAVVATFAAIHLFGVVGAAIADDVVLVVYLAAHLWIYSSLIELDARPLIMCVGRTVLAAAAMAGVLLSIGTDHFSAVWWVIGAFVGGSAFIGTLMFTGEVTVTELQLVASRTWGAAVGR